MKKCFFIVVLLMLQAGFAMASGVVVSNGIEAITPAQLKGLYRGKINNISGERVKLVDLEPLQEEFLKKIVGKPLKRYKKIWARKLFIEGVLGPIYYKTPEKVIKYVKETPNSIAYLPSVPEGASDLKVLLKF